MKDKRHRLAALQGGYLLDFICKGCSKILESGRFTTLPGTKSQAAFNRLREAHGHGDALCCGSCCPGNAESGAGQFAAGSSPGAAAPPAKPVCTACGEPEGLHVDLCPAKERESG